MGWLGLALLAVVVVAGVVGLFCYQNRHEERMLDRQRNDPSCR